MNIIICTHGRTGKELIKSVEMIMGKQKNVYSVSFNQDENTDDIIKKYKSILDKNSKNDSLFLVDLFGGSPFNAAVSLAFDKDNIEVVTGVNIPMLLEVLMATDEDSLEKITEVALKSGKKGIQRLDLNDK